MAYRERGLRGRQVHRDQGLRRVPRRSDLVTEQAISPRRQVDDQPAVAVPVAVAEGQRAATRNRGRELRRVFAQDVLTRPCGGRRSVTVFVTDQRLAPSLLIALGLPAEPATFAPARDPPQAELAWDEPS